MPRENCCQYYPWYCDACPEEWYDGDKKVWLCPFDDAVSTLSVLETDIIYSEKED